jgi:phosphatidate cytidylyltransferase
MRLSGRTRGTAGLTEFEARTVSWLALAPLIVLPAYFGGWWLAAVVALIALQGMRELLAVTGVKGYGAWASFWVVVTVVLAEVHREAFYLIPGFVIILTSALPVLRKRTHGAVYEIGVVVFGLMYLAWLFSRLIFLRAEPGGFGHVVFMGTCVAINDNAAYWSGKLFGRYSRRLIPEISPGKTVAGFLGGAAATLAVALLFHFAIPAVSQPQLLVLAGLIALTGPMGDLVISVIKRDRQVKDMGTILPGHGGVLDRFDSILYTTPIYYFALAVLGLRR